MHVRRADQQHHQQRLLGRKTKFNGVGKQPPRVERPTTARSTNHRQSAHLGEICILQSESPRARHSSPPHNLPRVLCKQMLAHCTVEALFLV